MTNTELAIYPGLALVGIILSAMFSGSETGLYTLNRIRLAVRASAGDRRAMRLRRILAAPNRMLATILVGNNIANYLGSFGVAAILESMQFTTGQAVVINAAILIPVIFILGEVLPKDLFRTHTDRWSYACSGFLAVVDRILTWTGLTPIVGLFGQLVGAMIGREVTIETTARQRISHLIKEGLGTGLLSESQTTLADRALALRGRIVGSEMIPWRDVTRISVDATPRARETLMRQRDYTRMPVVDNHGRVVGIISTLDALLRADLTTAELMTEPMFIDIEAPVRDALRSLRAARQTMAVVVAPGTRRPVGLVTLKDLIEPLTGELAVW